MVREHTTRKFKDIDKDEMLNLAYAYCDDCMGGKKEVATGSGKIVEIRDRYVPTIDYFLDHWLRRHNKEFYHRMQLWTIGKIRHILIMNWLLISLQCLNHWQLI